jgi:flavin-dependent dehydrogenase
MVIRDVVIVGAGLAGSSLATVLSNLGWDVLLLERRHLPQHKVCGEFLSPESQASLWALGLYDTVAALGPSQMSHALLVSARGRSLQVALPGEAWGISRFGLDAALADAARDAGAELQTGVTVTELIESGGSYRVELQSGQDRSVVQARAVVAGCGRHPVPNLRPTSAKAHSRQTFVGVKCHYQDVIMPPQVELFLFRGGYAGLAPIEDGRFNLCLLVTREIFARAGGTVRSMLDAAARWNPELGHRLVGARPLHETEIAVAPVDTGQPGVPWDTTARVGDAAVMIPPLCGDGQAMALRSAELCAPLIHDFLQRRLSVGGLKVAYEAAWHHEFDRRIHIGRHLQTLLGMRGVSDALLGIGSLFPRLASQLMLATRGQPRSLRSVSQIAPAAPVVFGQPSHKV